MAWKLLACPSAGLDIGSYSVKLLVRQSRPGAGGWSVAEAPIEGAEAGIPPTPERVAAAISQCLSRAGLSPQTIGGITTGIAGPHVVIKELVLPPLEDREVGPALRFEARKHVPFDPQGMVIDYQVLGRHQEDRRLKVLLAAASEEQIERHLAPLRLVGVEPRILEATPLALTNALLEAGENNGDAQALLDIGYTTSHLTLHQPDVPYFTRRLDFGGHHLTRAIAAARRLPLDEAETWKLAAGSETSGTDVAWDGPEWQAMLDCLRIELMAELRRSFAFYRTIGPLPEPLRVRISGGSARLPGLAARVGELLGSETQVFDPLVGVRGGITGPLEPSAGPQFSQAYGLALRTA